MLKDNDVRLVTYVPDNVLTPLIKGIHPDNYFMPANATREDEAMGIVAGAWMAGMKGAVERILLEMREREFAHAFGEELLLGGEFEVQCGLTVAHSP